MELKYHIKMNLKCSADTKYKQSLMLEIIAEAEERSELVNRDILFLKRTDFIPSLEGEEAVYNLPIHEVFDKYNEYYHIEEIHKKCLVFKTDRARAYLYLFPSLPKDKQIQNFFVERKSYIIPDKKNTKIQPQGTPFIVYPNLANMQIDFFKFIECEFHLKVFVNELEIDKARY